MKPVFSTPSYRVAICMQEEQAARIASLEQDKALLAAENEKLHAEVESLRCQLNAARQEQLGEQLGQPQPHTPTGLPPVPA